ncbi:MAG: PAS domain-containing protein [Pseudomonadota bacterium]
MNEIQFETPDLLRHLEAMDEAELDTLSFGVIRMDRGGIVTAYNSTESQIAGLRREQALGKEFFIQVAPCANNYMVAQRYLDAPELDEFVDYVFTYIMRPTPVKLRLLQSAGSARYLIVQLATA